MENKGKDGRGRQSEAIPQITSFQSYQSLYYTPPPQQEKDLLIPSRRLLLQELRNGR